MFAVNAYEMLQNGNWFSLYYNGEPDLFNTKPPLTVWLQCLSIKCLGYNEFAVRFPSALAAAGTVLMVFKTLRVNSKLWAWSSSLVLLTASGFLTFHTGRTGDADALMTFFLTCSVVSFWRFLEFELPRSLLLTVLFTALAVLTKLHAGLVFIPVFLGFTFYDTKWKSVFSSLQFWGALLIAVLGVGAVFYMRELDSPGYLSKLFLAESERFGNAIHDHKETYHFYLQGLFGQRFGIWVVLSLLGGFLIFKVKKGKRILQLAAFCSLFYLCVITLAKTKLQWYDMPLFPLLAVLGGAGISFVIQQLFNEQRTKFKWAFLALIFLYPYKLMFDQSQANQVRKGEAKLEANSVFLYESIKSGESCKGIKVLHTNWNGSLLFYKYKLKELGQDIEIVNDLNRFKRGDEVLVSDKELIQELQKKYSLNEIRSIEETSVFLLE